MATNKSVVIGGNGGSINYIINKVNRQKAKDGK